MALREYRRKRDFRRTPEPKGRLVRRANEPRFVVHRHHATRLHWDVRLEMDGVLASWAVPQGPPLEGGKRRLAVHTEDHPLQYLTFEGVIPDGYGAGTMSIWDAGTYAIEKREAGGRGPGGRGPRARSAVGRGPQELKITFKGERLTGSYVLVQTAQNEGRDWLMIKHAAAAPADHPLLERIEPMLAELAREPFDSPQWAFEPKWDGVRTIAFVDGAAVRLQSRNLRDVTPQYPEVELSVGHALVRGYQAILDGEIVALDREGRPSFQLLQPRMHQTDATKIRQLRRTVPVFYYLFDVLWLDGQDLRARPMSERTRRLSEVIEPMGAVRLSEQIPASGTTLFAAAHERGLEGIVAKRFDAPYVSGRTSLWLKVKAKRTTECVIGGWTEGSGGRTKTLGAVLLGVYEDGALRYVGHAGSGFDESTLRHLLDQLREREVSRPPFALVPPKTNAPAHWARPELVCTVEFTEWTAEGSLRHPVYKGLRPDIEPRECRGQERAADPKTATRRAAEEVKARAAAPPAMQRKVPAILSVDGKELRLTNLDKVLFPENGYTKADLIRYYIDASTLVLPYLRGRPLTLKPYPDGIHGTRFYQKDKPQFTPKWVQTHRDFSETKQEEIEYVVCNDLPTLVWLANYTVIEMHPWLSRIDDPEHPDFVMIDLDPQTGASFADVKTVAGVVRELLDARKLRGLPKTTGSRGLHVLVPVARRYTYDEVRDWVQELAAETHERLPRLITREWVKEKRGARIMIDYLQNRYGATTAGPYSVRPMPGAPVSMPVAWDEIGDLRGSGEWTIANARERFAQVGDLLAPAYALEQRLR